jgi:hypothetical protein
MAGIEERVRGFLESWDKIQGNAALSADQLKCCACGCELKNGDFAIIDGDPVCLKCRDKMKGA